MILVSSTCSLSVVSFRERISDTSSLSVLTSPFSSVYSVQRRSRADNVCKYSSRRFLSVDILINPNICVRIDIPGGHVSSVSYPSNKTDFDRSSLYTLIQQAYSVSEAIISKTAHRSVTTSCPKWPHQSVYNERYLPMIGF